MILLPAIYPPLAPPLSDGHAPSTSCLQPAPPPGTSPFQVAPPTSNLSQAPPLSSLQPLPLPDGPAPRGVVLVQAGPAHTQFSPRPRPSAPFGPSPFQVNSPLKASSQRPCPTVSISRLPSTWPLSLWGTSLCTLRRPAARALPSPPRSRQPQRPHARSSADTPTWRSMDPKHSARPPPSVSHLLAGDPTCLALVPRAAARATHSDPPGAPL